MCEAIEEPDDMDKLGQGFASTDLLEEVDIGDGTIPRLTFVKQKLEADYKSKLIALVREYVDCFAWEYHEMPGLSRELVEHRLPIKAGFRPHKQPARKFNPTIYDRIKAEIGRLLEANFIRPCKYAEWISNIVPVEKKGSGKIRACIDFRDVNRATPKDEYPMPIADMLINEASGHKVISFLDGNAGYNQIFMAEEDSAKTAFRWPGFAGLFEWTVMTFGLKNAGATYQRAMNLIFHDLLGVVLEVYIDDVVVKSDGESSHLADLQLAFERMRKYGLKMNPLKCAFGVSAGKFLGFIIHEDGIEIDPAKIEAIQKMTAPSCKKEMQKFLGKVNYLRRFITNLSGKVDAFTEILRLKNDDKFTWGAKQQEAFDKIKICLSTPPVLRKPTRGQPFRLYIAAEEKVIGAALTQEAEGKEYVVTYLSRRLLDVESRYSFLERLCMSLYFACTKLRHYLLSSECQVLSQTDVLKHMIQKPILSGRIGKWAYGLIEYELAYEPLKSMKGQIVADFIVEHRVDLGQEADLNLVSVVPWRLYFDGSVCDDGQGVGVVYISPHGNIFEASCRLDYLCTNNEAEYEALLFGLELLVDAGVTHIEAYGDSLLVVQQVSKICQCHSGTLNVYLDSCLEVISKLDYFNISHVPRQDNWLANELAQQASGYHISRGMFFVRQLPVTHVANLEEAKQEASLLESAKEKPKFEPSSDWRKPYVDYLQDPSRKADRAVRRTSLKYTLEDAALYRRTVDGLLLKCLNEDEARVAMGEVHDGLCGTHQSAHKMKWMLRRTGFYWPTMINDCFRYYKGCEACQKFGDIQLVPASPLNPIIKPWPFRGWALDFVGMIHPASSKGHRFVLVATDYFTKWSEAVPLRNMTHKEVIQFITEHIVHRFGIPQTLTTDQGTSFMAKEVKQFAESLGIKMLNSSPYYAQANGQAESSNKILIKLIKKKVQDFPRRWHEVLSEALWAHRISRHGATKVTPFELVYGQEAVLPIEVNLAALRLVRQNDLSADDYCSLMMDNIDEVADKRVIALSEIKKEKLWVARSYNKKVRLKDFQIDDLVWKVILPVGSRSRKFGKWSPNWEGPLRIARIVPGNSYLVETLEGYMLPRAINGKYLKKFHPSVWQTA